MTRSPDEIARTITPDSRLVVWRRTRTEPAKVLVTPDLRTAGVLVDVLEGECEVVDLLDVEEATKIITAARRMADAESSLERARSDAENRGKELKRALTGLTRPRNASIPEAPDAG